MIRLKKIYLSMGLFIYSALASVSAWADLPSYAQGGDLSSQLEDKGLQITEAITLIATIVGVIAIAGSAVFFGTGNAEKGKSFLTGGLIAIFIAGAVYAIAGLVG